MLRRGEAHRPSRRHELGVLSGLLPADQRAGRASGSAACTRPTACCARSTSRAIEELQRDGRLGGGGRAAGGRGARRSRPPARSCSSLCTNTMHKVAEEIAAAVDVPFVHIADTTADAVPRRRPLDRRPARDRLHHGAGLLRRAPARSPRTRRARPRRRPTGDRARRHLRRAVRRAWSTRGRARSTGRIMRALADRGAEASCSAAPRSTCSWARRTRRFPSSTRRACTPSGPSSSPSLDPAQTSRLAAT